MNCIPLAALAALLLSPAVLADRFYLGSPQAAEKMAEGSSPNVIHGVLLDESSTSYTIRVVGGTVMIPKSLVYKIEKDDLSVEAIETREKEMAEKAAESMRGESHPAETPPMILEVEEHEGDHHPSAYGHAYAVDAHHHGNVYDPVIGAILHAPHYRHYHDLAVMIVELEYLYEATHDHRYIKLARRLRRAR